mmetsp:Transcript_19971/g.53368  ORF Transcript_19971/g.53368 Transcript_19971/m.53368 type:complete len:230 (-) Transcript_19971:378-1067(-)
MVLRVLSQARFCGLTPECLHCVGISCPPTNHRGSATWSTSARGSLRPRSALAMKSRSRTDMFMCAKDTSPSTLSESNGCTSSISQPTESKTTKQAAVTQRTQSMMVLSIKMRQGMLPWCRRWPSLPSPKWKFFSLGMKDDGSKWSSESSAPSNGDEAPGPSSGRVGSGWPRSKRTPWIAGPTPDCTVASLGPGRSFSVVACFPLYIVLTIPSSSLGLRRLSWIHPKMSM